MKKLFFVPLVCALVLLAAVSVFFVPRQKTYVCVQDELFDIISRNNVLPETGTFSVVSQTDFQKIAETVHGKTARIAAVINIEKRFAFQPFEENAEKKAYLI